MKHPALGVLLLLACAAGAQEGDGLLEALREAFKSGDAAARAAAVEACAKSKAPAAGDLLKDLYSKETELEPRRAILRTLAALKHAAASELALAVLRDAENQPGLVAPAALIAAGGEKALVTALLRVVRTGKNPAALAGAIEGVGALGNPGSVGLLQAHLAHENTAVALATLRALERIGGDTARDAAMPAVDDPRLEIRRTAIRVLGTFRSVHTHYALFKAYLDPETRPDALRAVTQAPDLRALDLYLEGLVGADPALRSACRKVLSIQGVQALKLIDRKIAANALGVEVLAELRALFGKPRPILRWDVVGPMARSEVIPFKVEENAGALTEYVWKGKLAVLGGRDAGWESIDARDDGYVDLAGAFAPNTNAMAFLYASVETAGERTTDLLLGADDAATFWLNGEKVFDSPARGAWKPEEHKIQVTLKRGINNFMVRCAQSEGGWGISLHFSEAKTGPLFEGTGVRRDPAEYRDFALKNAGDAGRGEKLFSDPKAAGCVRCHAAGGEGGSAGPDLKGVGARFGRKELAEAVLEPSKSVKEGFEQELVLVREGHLYRGVVKDDTPDELVLADSEGNQRRLLKIQVRERRKHASSIMPGGLSAPLSTQDFADLVAFLESLKAK